MQAISGQYTMSGLRANYMGFFSQAQRYQKNERKLKEWLEPQIEEHKRKFHPNDVNDIIDAYLKHVQRLQERGVNETSMSGG